MATPAVLDGIAQQVADRRLYHRQRRDDVHRRGLDADAEVLVAKQVAMVIDNLGQQLVQRDALGASGQPRRIACQHQQQLDQLLNALRRTQHALHLLARPIRQARLFQCQFRGAGHHRDRRAQLMAGGTDEHPLALDELLVAVQVVIQRIGDAGSADAPSAPCQTKPSAR
ncbi:hypothetical protein G6F31_018302 [Rhizopus arrhizus]|nr:hypothetical protein G6F31_018302 [Rhizopus arrhizus]